jgi:hypothetical protein
MATLNCLQKLADTATYALRDQRFPAPLWSLTVRASQLLPSKDNQWILEGFMSKKYVLSQMMEGHV